ncbi:MAG: thiamine diphosphokinase [Roseovarius sp.]
MIVQSLETLALIGGVDPGPKALDMALQGSETVVAADGGADWALSHDVMPDAVIGDLDSISDAARARIPADRLHFIDDQDTTDFDKCLSQIRAPLIIGVGFTGQRQDHQLACYNSLVRFAHQRCILLSDDELVFLAPPSCRIALEAGTRVSLFPFGAVEGVSDGLEWNIAGLNFAPDGRVGTSNRATGPVHLSLTSPKMLVVLPAATLALVTQAFAATAARWD